MRVVADTLKSKGIVVVLLHPGASTDRAADRAKEHPVQMDPDVAVGHMRKAIESVSLRDSGRVPALRRRTPNRE